MRFSHSTAVVAGAILTLHAAIASASDPEKMKSDCRDRATKTLGVAADDVQVKYEGQRTDKTHAVNGSAIVGGQSGTFQCSFNSSGSRIVRFVSSVPRGTSKSIADDTDARLSAAARRAGEGSFDATGRIPCAQHKGQPMGQCDFGVARGGAGSATVVITRSDGRTRAIFFSHGKALNADTSQADGYPPFRASKKGDLHFIQVGDERYEIPDAVIFGG